MPPRKGVARLASPTASLHPDPRAPLTKRLLVLGSTGSIGTQTLDLVRSAPEDAPLEVVGLAAASSWETVLEQVQAFRPSLVSMADPEAAARLREALGSGVEVLEGEAGVLELIRRVEFDVAIHGIVGAAGLRPSLAVLERGKTLGLANKESLVIAGGLLTQVARDHGAQIVPVDSEHSAVFQCLRGERLERVRVVHLTASGGPFRTRTLEEIRNATPEEALAHPNWDMGPRVTIGSATLMNKALEVIELHHLFQLPPEQIHVVVHAQSIVHSMVEFADGSVMAQLGPPDMRGPIHYAIHHPDRGTAELEGFSFERFAQLTFEAPDPERFPALALGFRVIADGGTAGAVLNAADEIAVEAFLERRISLSQLVEVSSAALDARPVSGEPLDLDQLLDADRWARQFATDHIARLSAGEATPKTS
ncbi:MAG: 1-deoxy-D-xylulose-5-phosphate reductoisomerase [Planctomycetes bacterium]|nr:1-deoxy-D-xylulose-5-phosphate reductoisomerase [Planctomycetota bacterium]